MQTIIKAADAADFLALIPTLAGYRPKRSLALVLFHGSRTLGVMRFDLPDVGSPAELPSFAATCIGLVCKVAEADGVAVVVYTDAAFRDDAADITGTALSDALAGCADVCGLRVADALCVAADGWGSYLDPACPEAGHPLAELEARAADALLPTRDIDPDQGSGAALPHVDLAAKERAGRALDSLSRAATLLLGSDHVPGADARVERDPDDDGGADPDDSPRGSTDRGSRADGIGDLDPQALAALCALDDLPVLFDDALDWDASAIGPFDAAVMLWCLARPALRDVALVQWCEDMDAGDRALDAQLDWDAGAEYPEHIAQRFWGEGPRPNAARLIAALALVRQLAAVAPRGIRPGALAAAAWISWALGRSTHAGWYAERALEIDPEHGLSGIVATMVGTAHLPEWAFDRPAT